MSLFATAKHAGLRFLRSCIKTSHERKSWIIAAALILAAAGAYLSTRLTVTTATSDILSPELPFIQNEERYRQVFPQKDRVIVVVDAPARTTGVKAASELIDRLRRHKSLFKSAESPSISPFFRDQRLLFLDSDQLGALLNRILRSRPVLSIFADDPTLRGLVGFLKLVQAGFKVEESPPTLLNKINSLADVVESQAVGRSAVMDWNKIFEMPEEPGNERVLVLADPVKDTTSLSPIRAPLSQLRSEIAAVTKASLDVAMRVTGLPVLQQNELDRHSPAQSTQVDFPSSW